jgi:hypothetical protein
MVYEHLCVNTVVKASPFTAGSFSPNHSQMGFMSQLTERVSLKIPIWIPVRVFSYRVWANVTNAGWAVHRLFNDGASITDVILMYNYDWSHSVNFTGLAHNLTFIWTGWGKSLSEYLDSGLRLQSGISRKESRRTVASTSFLSQQREIRLSG